MKITRLFTVLLIMFAILVSGCSRGPDDAKSDLAKMNVQYTGESFLDCIANKDKKAVSLFLEAGMSPSVSTVDGYPLLVATLTGDVEITKLLVEKGANVNEKHKVGMSPLIGAILSEQRGQSQQDIVKFLIEKGADINTPYIQKGSIDSPLSMATILKEQEVITILKNAGAK